MSGPSVSLNYYVDVHCRSMAIFVLLYASVSVIASVSLSVFMCGAMCGRADMICHKTNANKAGRQCVAL